MKHLKDYKYYDDLYDEITVHSCRLTERSLLESSVLDKDIKDDSGKLLTKEEKQHQFAYIHNIALYFEKGERYLQKEETIQKWMEEDRLRDRRVDQASLKELIRCNDCLLEMEVSLKTLDERMDKPDRVLFFLKCSTCEKRKGIFDDGEELNTDTYCPDCNSVLDSAHDKKEDLITIVYTCPHCKYSNTEELSLKSDKKEPSVEESKQYDEDRKRFCLSQDEGEKYREGKRNMEELKKFVDEQKDREKNKEAYEKVKKMGKVPFGKIKELLMESCLKEGYSDVIFEKPDMGRYLMIGFTMSDMNQERNEYDSRMQLKTLINDTLSETNWRLASEGLSYRMGFLTGRLRAYEREEELVKLVKKTTR